MLALVIVSIFALTLGVLIGRGDSRRGRNRKVVVLLPHRVFEARNPNATRKN